MLLFVLQLDPDLPGHQQARILKYSLGPQLDPEHHPVKPTHSCLLFDRLLDLLPEHLLQHLGASAYAQQSVLEPVYRLQQGL
jgi:hypothetical protein